MIRTVFLVLPAFTILFHLTSAIPTSEALRAIVTNWRNLMHGLLSLIIGMIPFIPDLRVPELVLDELGFALLLLGSIGVSALAKRLPRSPLVTEWPRRQLSSTLFWVSVVAMCGVFFLVYDFRFYFELMEGRRAAEGYETDPTLSLVLASTIWAYLLGAIVVLRPGSEMHWLGSIFGRAILSLCVILLLCGHVLALRDVNGENHWFWGLSFFAMIAAAATIVLLRKYNRNSIAIMLVIAAAILAADQGIAGATPFVESVLEAARRYGGPS